MLKNTNCQLYTVLHCNSSLVYCKLQLLLLLHPSSLSLPLPLAQRCLLFQKNTSRQRDDDADDYDLNENKCTRAHLIPSHPIPSSFLLYYIIRIRWSSPTATGAALLHCESQRKEEADFFFFFYQIFFFPMVPRISDASVGVFN